MKAIGLKFLEQTNQGLDIFQKYINTPFTVGEKVEANNMRFEVAWNERYGNYAIYIERQYSFGWDIEHRFNAIWFLKWQFDISEEQVYATLRKDMGLTIDSKAAQQYV